MQFFVPFSQSPEQAERIYTALRDAFKTYPLLDAHDTKRIFSLQFCHKGSWHEATVGKAIEGWPEPAGPVLAVIATTGIVYVHTAITGPRAGTHTILAGQPERARKIRYFDCPA